MKIGRQPTSFFLQYYKNTEEHIDGEEWKDIPGYGGMYLLSNFGRVKTNHNKGRKFISITLIGRGQLKFNLNKINQKKAFHVPMLVAKLFGDTKDSFLDELWNAVPGYEKLYEASTHGRIRRIQGTFKNFILQPGLSSNGYYVVVLCKDNNTRPKRVHRIIADAWIPNPENKKCINHKDGNKLNNHISNLERATHSENNKHAYDIGLRLPSKRKKNEQAHSSN